MVKKPMIVWVVIWSTGDGLQSSVHKTESSAIKSAVFHKRKGRKIKIDERVVRGA